jgi:hypothetical protein
MRGALLVCGLAAMAACHDLPALGTCGNGIAEAANGEACDDGGPSATCTASCELACTASAGAASYIPVGTDASGQDAYCPDASYRCGADAICRAPSGRFAPLAAALPFDVAGSPVLGDIDNDGLPDLVGTSATSISIRFGSTAGTPLGALVVQEAPSAQAPYAIFDLHPGKTDPVQSDTMIAIPTEGVALLRSDGERFTPELDLNPVNLPILTSDTLGLVVRDPDPALGDVVIAIQSRSATPSITVVRPPVGQPGIAIQPLPPCVGTASGSWRTIDAKATPDRSSFVVVTQRDNAAQPAAQPWHVCRYTQAGTGWTLTGFELAPPAPSSIVLANVDADPCSELVVHVDGDPGLAVIDATGGGCGFTPAIAPLPIVGTGAALLGAGDIIPGAGPGGAPVDELVLGDGVYRACTGPASCGATTPTGTFLRVASPTQGPWRAAAIADLNGDSVLDVVAARGEADVDVVRGGAVPNVYRANTSEPVTSLVAGDFDGDRLGDVAMVESSPPGDRVTVLFGTREASVGAPLAMSPFGGRLRLDRLSQISWIPSTRGSDGIDDLLVLSTGTTLSAGVLVGDAARLMTTPRFPPMTPTAGTPLGAVAAGSFGGDSIEILAITGTQAQHYDIQANRWAPPIDLGMQLNQPVGALRDGPSRTLGAARGTGDHDLVVFSVRGAFTKCQVTGSSVPRELRGVDIDGDGIDELAVLSDDGAGDRGLQLFRAEGCPLAPLLAEVLAGCVDVANAGDRLVAICRSNGGPVARDLVEITHAGSTFTRNPTPLAQIDGDARFVTAGDFDGDGVLDIAVGVHHGASVGIQLLKQCPAHDVRACR